MQDFSSKISRGGQTAGKQVVRLAKILSDAWGRFNSARSRVESSSRQNGLIESDHGKGIVHEVCAELRARHTVWR
jgi:hypothetical protein